MMVFAVSVSFLDFCCELPGLNKRFPESTTSWDTSDFFFVVAITYALPDSPPSCFAFQPHGSISPATFPEKKSEILGFRLLISAVAKVQERRKNGKKRYETADTIFI